MMLPISVLCAYSVPVRLKRMFSSLSVAAGRKEMKNDVLNLGTLAGIHAVAPL